MMDAGYVTALRTAAASAVATRSLAQASSRHLAVLGTGEQARFHIQAMLSALDVEEITVWGRSSKSAERLIDDMEHTTTARFHLATSGLAAVEVADVVCTVTASPEPVLLGEWLQPGTHVNAVGASVPTAREIDVDVVKRGRYFVDYKPSALAQAGELKAAFESGELEETCIRGEIGQVLLGQVDGRIELTDITVYRSLGVAAQDLAAAHAIAERAEAQDLGTVVEI